MNIEEIIAKGEEIGLEMVPPPARARLEEASAILAEVAGLEGQPIGAVADWFRLLTALQTAGKMHCLDVREGELPVAYWEALAEASEAMQLPRLVAYPRGKAEGRVEVGDGQTMDTVATIVAIGDSAADDLDASVRGDLVATAQAFLGEDAYRRAYDEGGAAALGAALRQSPPPGHVVQPASPLLNRFDDLFDALLAPAFQAAHPELHWRIVCQNPYHALVQLAGFQMVVKQVVWWMAPHTPSL